MKEQIIGFEVALLAQEKGFDPFPNNKGCYSKTGKYTLLDGYKGYVEHQGEIGKLYNSDVVMQEDKVPASTQSLLQKWLREEHGYHVQPQKTFHNKTYSVGKIPSEFRIKEPKFKDTYGKPLSYLSLKGKFNTYEEALEAGLKHVLQLIK